MPWISTLRTEYGLHTRAHLDGRATSSRNGHDADIVPILNTGASGISEPKEHWRMGNLTAYGVYHELF